MTINPQPLDRLKELLANEGPFTAGLCQVFDDNDLDGAAVFSGDGQPFCLIDADTVFGEPLPRAEMICEALNLIAALETLAPSAGEREPCRMCNGVGGVNEAQGEGVYVGLKCPQCFGFGSEEIVDLISDALDNSMGPDWSTRTGAKYVADALSDAGFARAALASPPEQRQWSPHLDYSGEPMGLGEFRDPLEQPDIEAIVLAMLNELHANVPEDKRPMSMSDLSDDQAARAKAAVRKVQALSLPTTEIRREALEEASAAVEAERERLRATVRDNLLDNFDRGQLNGCEQALKVIRSLAKEDGRP